MSASHWFWLELALAFLTKYSNIAAPALSDLYKIVTYNSLKKDWLLVCFSFHKNFKYSEKSAVLTDLIDPAEFDSFNERF